MSSGGLGKVKRESNFKRFRNRWKRRGLLEIDESHSKYVFTSYIKEGLENVVPVTKDDDAYQVDPYYISMHQCELTVMITVYDMIGYI